MSPTLFDRQAYGRIWLFLGDDTLTRRIGKAITAITCLSHDREMATGAYVGAQHVEKNRYTHIYIAIKCDNEQ